MDSPANDIEAVIKTLCTGSAREQDEALHKYFLPDAAFVHPLCWVPRFNNIAIPFFGTISSLWLVQCIYRWYRVLFPNLEITINSTAFDEKNNILYVNATQTIPLWFFPLYSPTVTLTPVLTLEKRQSRLVRNGSKSPELDSDTPNGASILRYYIAQQQDLYQVNSIVTFFLPYLGSQLWAIVQLVTTGICMAMAVVTLPLHYYLNQDNKKKIKQ